MVSAVKPPYASVIADVSPIIGLSLVGGLEWLEPLFGAVSITRAVRDELLVGFKTAPRPGMALINSAIKTGWVNVLAKNSAATNLPHLDESEASVLAAAIIMQSKGISSLVIIDETLGRATAQEHGINCTGLVGIILAAKKRRLVKNIKPILQQLQNQNFRLSSRLIAFALARACEK